MSDPMNARITESFIIAEIILSIDGERWAAIVTQLEDGITYQLWYDFGTAVGIRQSGQFTNAKALVKFIRAKVAEKSKVGRVVVEKDTLDQLATHNGISVVPICYAKSDTTHNRNCSVCPYRVDCKRNTQFVIDLEKVDSADTEDETSFLDRLHKKLSATKWEGGANGSNPE
jgi:hypothetical protein